MRELDDPRAIIDPLEDLRYRDHHANRIEQISRKDFVRDPSNCLRIFLKQRAELSSRSNRQKVH